VENNLAVLIDFENIATGTDKEGLGRFDVEAVLGRLKERGRILIARSYADWGRFSRYKQTLLANNITMMELTSHGMQDKNRADIALVVDALDLAFNKPYIDTFVVISGDSDFTPMVQKMRELDKRVIGVGTRHSTSRLLVNACDEFIFYESIVQAARRERTRPSTGEPMGRDAAFDLLVAAIEGLQRENPEPPLASVVKTAMQRKSPDFSESDLGHNSFARFLEAAQQAGRLKIIRDPKAGGYRVDVLHDEASAASPSAEPTVGDPYLPAAALAWRRALATRGFELLSEPIRMSVLSAFVDVVRERRDRRRRVVLSTVIEDVLRVVRRQHPDIGLDAIRSHGSALLRAGRLMHRDGSPIRTEGAIFSLRDDAPALNTALAELYLTVLAEVGEDLGDVDALAETLYGSRDRRGLVEKSLAWLSRAEEPDGEPADLDAVDMDSLLETAVAVEAAPAEGDEARRKRRRRRKADEPAAVASEGELPNDLDALLA
jgi:uncharacterized protein (TIGR00288 family)